MKVYEVFNIFFKAGKRILYIEYSGIILKIMLYSLFIVLILAILAKLGIIPTPKFENDSIQNGGFTKPLVNQKESFSNITKSTVKCLGKRDGISGCRDCCSRLYKSFYNTCVNNCMNH